MWFWWFMLICDLLIPITMLIGGRMMWKHCPKRINILFAENLLKNPVTKLFYFGDKKSAIHFHIKAPI